MSSVRVLLMWALLAGLVLGFVGASVALTNRETPDLGGPVVVVPATRTDPPVRPTGTQDPPEPSATPRGTAPAPAPAPVPITPETDSPDTDTPDEPDDDSRTDEPDDDR